jgi:hypothetical protein
MRTAQDQIKQEKSDQRWNDIPRGTMDEVSSYFRLNLPSLTARPLNRLFHLVFESHHGRALGPSPKRSATARGQGIGLGEVLKHIAEKEPALASFKDRRQEAGPSSSGSLRSSVRWRSSLGKRLLFYGWSRSDAQEQARIQNRCVNQTTVDGTLHCHCSYHHHLRTDDPGAIMTRRCEKRMSVASDRGVHE